MPLVKHGSEALKRRFLPRIATGEIVMSFGVTEPNTGTDTSRIETRAERRGGRFVVNGRKVWNANARAPGWWRRRRARPARWVPPAAEANSN